MVRCAVGRGAGADVELESSSFGSLRSYARALMETPSRVAKRALAVGSAEQEVEEARARSGTDMQRQLRWWDVVGLGVGGMVGAGVFVSTGQAARDLAGPAVVLSYAVAGLAALLSAFCYTEFAVDVPTAGGAFSYLRITFGELPAYLTGANLIMEYVISNAAVARSFTSYFLTAISVAPTQGRVKVAYLPPGFDMLDFPAVGLVTIITMCICRSTKCSSVFNCVVTLVHLALIAFIIIAGFTKGSFANMEKPAGFLPYGVRGVFTGAALVFYSYIGYDSVSTMAEETHKPAKTMPIGIAGSVVIVTVLYCFMGAALVMLVPYDKIDARAPFPLAFKVTAGWQWASNVVGLGACVGIWSSLIVAMLGQARYMCVIGRANVVPLWFARVDACTGTPFNASVSLGACTAVVALLTDFDVLMELISIGTLFVFYMVANALIARRYMVLGKTTTIWPTIVFLLIISVLAMMLVLLWRLGKMLEVMICATLIIISTTAFKLLVPDAKRDTNWKAPLMPFGAVASVVLNVFLAGSLKLQAFHRFGTWSAGALMFYLLYSVHATHDANCLNNHLQQGHELQMQANDTPLFMEEGTMH